MDLEFILDEMVIDADPFALCELHGCSDLKLRRDPASTLHYVLAGAGKISMPEDRSIPLAPGTLALIPGLRSHTLHSNGQVAMLASACRPVDIGLRHILVDGPDAETENGLVAVCARVTVGINRMQNMIRLVRSPITEKATEDSPLIAPIKAILSELASPKPGSRAMLQALLRVLIIELMRCRLAAGDVGLLWMKALRDPQLWPVLLQILDHPGDPHSVESLAETSGLSRSVFARRFSEAYGAGPMELLREVRMQTAAGLLQDSNLPVKRIAETVGFRSRSSFSRAFEASVGCSPQQFRVAGRAA